MAGRLYGVGVGPGDPELLTIKGVRIIRECRAIVIPAGDTAECVAYGIARQAVPEIEEKDILTVSVPMTTDRKKLEEAYEKGFEKIQRCLDREENVAFLNLGDPSVYGTYMKLHERALDAGYSAEIISGVPSFCAAAAALNMALAMGKEKIHILPGYYQEDGEVYEGTRVFMKSAGKTGEIKSLLMEMEENGKVEVRAVENCGMENQKIYRSAGRLGEKTGYFTTIIVKDREDR